MNRDDRVFTPRELATLLKISPATVRRMVQDGSVGYTKIGNQLRFTREDVDTLLTSRRVTPKR